jgi:hypothetical protein
VIPYTVFVCPFTLSKQYRIVLAALYVVVITEIFNLKPYTLNLIPFLSVPFTLSRQSRKVAAALKVVVIMDIFNPKPKNRTRAMHWWMRCAYTLGAFLNLKPLTLNLIPEPLSK